MEELIEKIEWIKPFWDTYKRFKDDIWKGTMWGIVTALLFQGEITNEESNELMKEIDKIRETES